MDYTFSKEELGSIPKAPGQYFLYRRDDMVYTGISKNIHRRVRRHRRDKIFDKVRVLIMFGCNYRNQERQFLSEFYTTTGFLPAYNKQI